MERRNFLKFVLGAVAVAGIAVFAGNAQAAPLSAQVNTPVQSVDHAVTSTAEAGQLKADEVRWGRRHHWRGHRWGGHRHRGHHRHWRRW
ncbi:MAG: twin-arginine translocation signal domain-containing protein [Alphaproteobacteria bacterium]|nr:twin-arginine translocation signal domain-containing protein [Alphaproteobacteria bacterium]